MLFEVIHIITMLVAAVSPNMNFLMVVRFFMGLALGALLTILLPVLRNTCLQEVEVLGHPEFHLWEIGHILFAH
ncbi:hypothetical protein SDC49_08985 [Lactobacillus sp. R2/2]|nr:hypothetical protein [Lactobacillus sp. R2/2]MEB3363822.1 hypothetical protein [Lactobacillus sp. R2/2]